MEEEMQMKYIPSSDQIRVEDEEEDNQEQSYGMENMTSFRFNKCAETQKKKVTIINNPEKSFRLIGPGLNLEGICMNEKCFAFKKKVWVRKSFGTFRINEEQIFAKCPRCQKTKLKDLWNMGIYKAKLTVVGKQKGVEDMFQPEPIIANDQDLHKFKEADDANIQWEILIVTTEPLK